MVERLKEIIQMNDDKRDIAEFAGIGLSLNQYDYLIEQAQAYEKLGNDYGKLQEFLQGRSTQFGEDVVDETIKYAKVLEHENRMLKKLTEELTFQLSEIRKKIQ